MDTEQQMATWAAIAKSAFCKAHNLSLNKFIEMDDKFQLIHYLFDNYELLCYYGDESVIEDIHRHIVKQGVSIGELPSYL